MYRRWTSKGSEKVEDGKGDSRRTVFGPIPKAEHGDRTGSANTKEIYFTLVEGNRRTIIHRKCRMKPRTRESATTLSVLWTIEICNQTAEPGEPREFKPEESPPRGTITSGAIAGDEISHGKVNSARSSTIEDVSRKRRSTIENRLIPESRATAIGVTRWWLIAVKLVDCATVIERPSVPRGLQQ